MNVACPQCATVFRVDPAKVPENGVRARCSECGGLIAVRRPHVGTPAVPPTIATPAAQSPPAPTIGAGLAAAPASFPPAAEPPPAPVAEAWTAAESPTAPAGAGLTPSAPAAPEPPPVPPVVDLPPRPESWAAPEPSQVPPVPEAIPAPRMPASVPFAALPVDAPAPRAEVATPSVGAPGRFSNPFLQQDPSVRARRLARALVSDLVVYHPDKRQRGLAEGTLKELFAEEIRKSWEEYSEQIGEDVARSTPYFTEALNEILAEGRRLFD